MDNFFVEDWTSIARALIAAPIVYALVVALARISGKRSVSQMNNFDWIVTVAIGSLVASTILIEDVSLIEGSTAIAALFALQYLLTFTARRSQQVEHLLKAQPKILFAHGEFVERAMTDERVTRSELIAELRESGVRRLEDVDYVILESDGNFSVIGTGSSELDGTVMANLDGHDRTPGR